jgi:hypothetical protein
MNVCYRLACLLPIVNGYCCGGGARCLFDRRNHLPNKLKNSYRFTFFQLLNLAAVRLA